MRKMLMVGFLGLFTLAGCGSAAVVANPDAKFPVAATDDAPAFLFPINLSHAGLKASGDPTKALAMSVSVTGQIAAKWGKKVISGQQLFDQVGNLSFDLAEKIKWEVEKKTFVMEGEAAHIADDLSAQMTGLSTKLVDLKIIDKPFAFKYVIAIHSHGEKGMVPNTVKVTSWGGIYDIEQKKILDYIVSSDTIADDDQGAGAIGQLPATYNHIIELLLQGNAAKS